MQVMYLGRAPRTKETLPNFLKWRRVTRPPLVFRRLTDSQRTPGFWGVTVVIRLIFACVMCTNVMCIGIVDMFYLFHEIANMLFFSHLLTRVYMDN